MFPACFQLITPNKSADHTRSLVHIHKYHKVTLCYMMMDLGINAAIWSRHTKSSTTGTLKRTSALFTRSSIPRALKTTCSLYTRSRITRTLKRTSSFIRFQRAMQSSTPKSWTYDVYIESYQRSKSTERGSTKFQSTFHLIFLS